MKGDFFGEVDFIFPAKQHQMDVDQMIDRINDQNFNLVRFFTVQAIKDCHMLTIDISNLGRMHKQFNSQFRKLFRDTT